MKYRLRRGVAAFLAVLALLAGLTPSIAGAQTAEAGNDTVGTSMGDKLAHTSQTNVAHAAVTPPTVTAECPPTIRCVVAPAAFEAIGGNVADYGNYDLANRPHDMKINSIVVHDGEGTCQEILDAFKNPAHYAATQYLVCRDGTVYQMVRNQDMPWHAGNWWYNMHSVGIEHEGHAALGGTEYTPQMYWASAQLVRYLTDRFGIPRDRGHIVGHDNVPAIKGSQLAGMHTDPGPFWDWQRYMALIGAPVMPTGGIDSGLVTIAPTWLVSKLPVSGCSEGDNGCAPTTPQPTNFVYLRVSPDPQAPLFADPILGQGSTDIKNNTARLFHGQTFAVADRQVKSSGVWHKVWVNGSAGWFQSPWSMPSVFPASGKYVTPKAGKASIPVYGRPVPELSAYPADLLATSPGSFWVPTLAPQAPLPYAISAGQRYTLLDVNPPNDHFYAWAIDSSFPYDHTIFKGTTKFYQIQFGNRVAFVKADDIDIR